MKKARLSLIFMLLCFAVCTAVSLGMLFAPAQPRANEILSAAPRIRTEAGVNVRFLSDLSDYISDRFFLRQELITARNALYALLGGPASADVLAGADGWLYYAPTLDDYTGLGAMDDAELASAVRNLSLMQEYCEAQGARFLFVPVPNKNSLYDAAMPDLGAKAQEHSAERLLRALEGRGVACLDLFSLFRGQPEILYFAHDSHWTAKGAALAADAINAALGRSSAYFAADFSAQTPHTGDLYEMRYPAGRDGETDGVYPDALRYTRAGSDTRPDSITINTSGGSAGSLLMFRDSFGNALYPYLADSFAAARFSRATAYDLAQTERLGADCVVVELVERNLRYLLRFFPVMPAPARTLALPPAVSGSVTLTAPEAQPALSGYTAYSGTLPEAYAGAPVYLICGDAAYEAFTGGDGSFQARLPEDQTPSLVAVKNENTLIVFQADCA